MLRFIGTALVALLFPAVAHAVAAGSGIAVNNGAVSTKSDTSSFLAQSSLLSCSGSPTGKIIVDTSAGTLAWCNGSTIKQSALGDDDGDALSLDTGAGSDGSRGIIFSDNVTSPAAPAANTTMLHTVGGNLFVYGQTGPATTSPGIPVLPQVKVVAADVTNIQTSATNITGLTGYTLKAGRKYVIEGSMTIVASAGTADPSVSFNFTGTTTGYAISVVVSCVLQTNAATSGYRITTAGSSNCIIGAAQTLNVHIFGFLQGATSNDLTLDLRASAAGAGTLTVEDGALVRISEFQ